MSTFEFIELNRTFYQLFSDYTQKADNDEIDLSEIIGLKIGDEIIWDELLKKHRVVLLSEAGSGKTEEIRSTAQKLRSKGKFAFFLRLENIPDDLEDSFEEGKFEEFEAWLESNEEGWLFLDSVDEARLIDPRDFEKAIKIISKSLTPALNRIHIVITSRANAWRAKTDLYLCKKYLPYTQYEKQGEAEDKDTFIDGQAHNTHKTKLKSTSDNALPEFYTLSDLSEKQIRTFLEIRSIDNISYFLDEVKRKDAEAYVSRPQDLEELIGYWIDNKKIGSRLDLVKNSIKRRLNERDQNRKDIKPVPFQKAYEGVMLLAAASTLMQQSNIKVPDGSTNIAGIDAEHILSNWGEELVTLLGRPIFKGGPYGTVRFHHRSVREFLTATWLFELLKNGSSRSKIEILFFREQYGIQVIVPSMRSILSWLVLFDEKIRMKTCSIEPEVILEGGDPSKLPPQTRKEVLEDVCDKIISDTYKRSATNYSSIQRFANPDMAESIKTLIKKHKKNTEITDYLMHMIWRGRIKQALPEAKSFALDSKTEKYTRIAAIKAIKEIGSDTDFQEIQEAILSQKSKIDRRVLAETIDRLDGSKEDVEWVVNTIKKAKNKERYSVDSLSYSLVKFAEGLEPDIASEFVKHINNLLRRKPVIERRFCEVSKRFGWLINCGARAVEKLITSQHSAALSPESLSILSKIPSFKEDADFENRSLTTEISEWVKDWKDLKFALFWKDIEETRKNIFFKKGERLTGFWQAYFLRQYWNFEKEDFECVKAEIKNRKLLDDRLVALSLAFQIYKENGRPRNWREQLKKLAEGEKELEKKLIEFLHPLPQSKEQKRYKREDVKWKRQNKKREEERQRNHAKSLEWLKNNFENLRDEKLLKETFRKNQYLKAQYYLLERMRKQKDDSSHWTQGNWSDLIEGFGEKIARAFREGLLLSWRFYTPKFRSEKDNENSTPVAVILGLSGLEIEARETANWPDGLSENDAILACRYAFQELNGFPSWFPELCKKFPKIVSNQVLAEIDWELASGQNGQAKHYIIDKVSWNGQVLWDDIAPELLKRLRTEPLSLKYLDYLLKVIQSSSTVPNQDVVKLASKKCKTLNGLDHIAHWFAAWISFEPDIAIEELSKYLEGIKDNSEAVQLAMSVIVNLVGDKHTVSNAQEDFKLPKHLKSLYLLMHKYIKTEEDINRAGKGAYSPELRDKAQEARNGLFSVLKDIPGKETYLALIELSKDHPARLSRSWMLYNAKERAEKDADISAWSDLKFLEYRKTQESTPINHRELFDLIERRLLDLKHDLEDGDTSNAPILIDVKRETKIRNYIGGWCRDRANGKYSIPQEEELADAKKPDLRVQGCGFDAPVPVELKLADNWTGPDLFERLENQLCGDYLRGNRSSRGVFLLVYRGDKTFWEVLNGSQKANFYELLEALQKHWENISKNYPHIEQINVIGIDLTKRLKSKSKKEK